MAPPSVVVVPPRRLAKGVSVMRVDVVVAALLVEAVVVVAALLIVVVPVSMIERKVNVSDESR